jgi:hypothetical protein
MSDIVFSFISNKFAWIPLYLYLLLLVVKKYSTKSWVILVTIGILITFSDQASNILKKNIKRKRPCQNEYIMSQVHTVNNDCGSMYGFVSAHSANAVALTIMIFLLALFMALAKRRDDVLLKLSLGTDMRKAVKGYNLEFINVALSLICAVIVVAYFMYTTSPEIKERLHYRLYYTCLFVLAGVFRYLQLIFVQQDSQSPTKILYKDRFIQIVILLWVISFYSILYLKNITIFN